MSAAAVPLSRSHNAPRRRFSSSGASPRACTTSVMRVSLPERTGVSSAQPSIHSSQAKPKISRTHKVI